MNTATRTRLALLAGALCALPATANERRFTYSYEPETLPKGAMEFEQWITLRTQRTSDPQVYQENYNRWDFRSEFEYGVTDRYTVGLYLNAKNESFRDVSVSPAVDEKEFEFDGLSLENRYMLLNPAEKPVGLTLYLEPTFSGDELELEEKIILGQRHGNWKWAVNLVHATEWEDNFHETVGELQATFGLARDFGPWSVGLEVVNQNEIPEYKEWEYSAIFVGPVVSYRRENFWATLTVLPQVWGRNYNGDPDGNESLVLNDLERVNIRLLFGFGF